MSVILSIPNKRVQHVYKYALIIEPFIFILRQLLIILLDPEYFWRLNLRPFGIFSLVNTSMD